MVYSKTLLERGISLTRFAHRSRFQQVLKTLKNQTYHQALDFGCGDGWLLKIAREEGLIKSGYGVDIAETMLSACQELFTGVEGFEFLKPEAMKTRIPLQSCDLLLCTETLEHVGNAERAIADFLRYGKPGAKVIITVPIEIGPSLIIKQIGRYLANLKGSYGYERYRFSELISASLFWDADSFESSHNQEIELRNHKGFDYRKLEKIVAEEILLKKRQFSPFSLFGDVLNSTVLWVGEVKAAENRARADR